MQLHKILPMMVLSLLAACGGEQKGETNTSAPGAAATTPAAGGQAVTTLTGAGATFPYPLYAKWAQAYQGQSGVGLNYQSIGSGGGIKQIQAKTVDFGATDKPMSAEELAKNGLVQFPAVIGGVVPVVNIKGVQPGQIKLDGKTLADIYLGKITKWNDPAITRLSPGVSLPDSNITVVHRSDGSGTTFVFTNYLAKVSPEWQSRVGVDASVNWPTGVGGKGNEGVAAYVQRIEGAIGYVEYAYAKENKMSHAALLNRDGQVVNPSAESFSAAAANATWKPEEGFAEILTDQPGAQSWPITAATFILVPQTADNPQKVQAVLKFFDWAYASGDQMALELDYVPLPDSVITQIRATWANIKDKSGQPVWTQ